MAKPKKKTAKVRKGVQKTTKEPKQKTVGDIEDLEKTGVLPKRPKKPVEINRFFQLLSEHYPNYPPIKFDSPVSCLVETILSQNTNDKNRDRGYQALIKKFPTWESVLAAKKEDVIEAIRPAGLPTRKGPAIIAALKKIKEDNPTHEISLSFLAQKSDEEVQEYLESMDGVGPKTASCVMLFSLDRSSFSVDTHIHRVVRRVGLVPFELNRIKTQEMMNKITPKEHVYQGHLHVIDHGRQVCTAAKPKCKSCFLNKVCMRKLK